MATALVFNPGSNSLKFELVELRDGQRVASDASKLASAALDDIGKRTMLRVYDGRKTTEERDVEARDMGLAVRVALRWLREKEELRERMAKLTLVGVRVVHGGMKHGGAARVTAEVLAEIAALEDLAPLHNQSSMDILEVLGAEMPGTPAWVTFDTAFHRRCRRWHGDTRLSGRWRTGTGCGNMGFTGCRTGTCWSTSRM